MSDRGSLAFPDPNRGVPLFETKNRRNVLIALIIAAVVIALAFGYATRADATTDDGTKCVPSPETSQVVVVTPAVPAVPEVPAVPAVTEEQTVPGTPDLWWNWSPNHQQGPFEGPPAFPVDPRGTWQGPHENGGPSQDTYGTFQQGSGNGSWFHREQGTPETTVTVVITPEVPAVPGTPEIPAVTKVVVTPAVECPEEPPVVVEPPVEPPVTPENPQVPQTPENPSTPNDDEDPVISKHTSSEPGKTVVTYTHESGKTTEEVRVYADDVKEEGL
jgi:hypothetical protein